MALVHYLGVKESPNSFSLPFGKEGKDNLEKIFDTEHVNRNKPVVCFHPSAVWSTKRWPREKVARLCDMLQEEFGCQVLFVGTDEEKEYLNHICSLLNGEVKNLAGKTSLRELACLVSRSDLVVSMDSGPMHISCAVGTPVVALFGPTAPWRTGPFGDSYLLRIVFLFALLQQISEVLL